MLAPFSVPLADDLSGFDLDAAIAMSSDDSTDALVEAIGGASGFDCGSDFWELVGVGHAKTLRIAYPFARFILRLSHFIFRGMIWP